MPLGIPLPHHREILVGPTALPPDLFIIKPRLATVSIHARCAISVAKLRVAPGTTGNFRDLHDKFRRLNRGLKATIAEGLGSAPDPQSAPNKE